MPSPYSARYAAADRASTIGLLAAGLLASTVAVATPLQFTLFNASSASQSRLNLEASAQFAGAALTATPQLAPGGLNGLGSLSTLYNDTGNGSRLAGEVTQAGIRFDDSGGAVARNAVGAFGNNLAIAPGVGATSGTAPANYGVKFSAPQNIPIPPIDLTPLGVSATLNLGTLTSFDAKVALRNVVVDAVGSVPLSAFGGGPQAFDATSLQVGISGTADLLIGATAKQASFADYLAAGLALTTLQSSLAGQGVNLTIQNNGFLALSYTLGLGLSTDLPAIPSGNDGAGAGRLEQVGNTLRLTLPLSFEFAPTTPVDFLFSARYALNGTFIGQSPFVAVEVPEPASGLMAALGTLALFAVLRRRPRPK